ncbi:MAG: hypothetical protein AAF368_07845, partial [Planctomycetota bacterium]
LHKAAEAEVKSERDRVMRSLQSLHMRLEASQISEEDFEEEEAALLDRLDELDGIADDEPDQDNAQDDGDEHDDDQSAVDAVASDRIAPHTHHGERAV